MKAFIVVLNIIRDLLYVVSIEHENLHEINFNTECSIEEASNEIFFVSF